MKPALIQPVFDFEALDPPGFSGIVGDQDSAQALRMGADLRIRGTDRQAGAFEVGPNRAVRRGRRFVEIGDFQGQEKFLQRSLDSL